MPYRIDVLDAGNRCIARYNAVPLLEAYCSMSPYSSVVRGLLPELREGVEPGVRVRVVLDGKVFAEAAVAATRPEWGDMRRLILDRYVNFHEVFAFEAREESQAMPTVSWEGGGTVSDIAEALVQNSIGAWRVAVEHENFPNGAQREYQKFLARKAVNDPLAVGSISTGTWVDASRIDATEAHALDGDTIAGVRVDGATWPPLRLLGVDAEETSLNDHAVQRHPEVRTWTPAQYARSGYARRAEKARRALSELLAAHGIAYIELNPHRDANGIYDDRVDAYGRYVATVFGGGMSYNAAVIEQGVADPYLYADGKYHAPEMRIKDYFSYAGSTRASLDPNPTPVANFVFEGELDTALLMLGYVGRCAVTFDPSGVVRIRDAGHLDRVVYYDPRRHSLRFGAARTPLANYLVMHTAPYPEEPPSTYARADSIEAYGVSAAHIAGWAFTEAADRDAFAEGLLNDVAYRSLDAELTCYTLETGIRVGELIEIRGAPLKRLHGRPVGEWMPGGRSALVGRVYRATYRFYGDRVETRFQLISPLRSVPDPLTVLRFGAGISTPSGALGLDDPTLGLDIPVHLDAAA
jgi:endonuclease YncB( thermonuclease family)